MGDDISISGGAKQHNFFCQRYLTNHHMILLWEWCATMMCLARCQGFHLPKNKNSPIISYNPPSIIDLHKIFPIPKFGETPGQSCLHCHSICTNLESYRGQQVISFLPFIFVSRGGRHCYHQDQTALAMIVLRCALSLPGSGVMLFKSRCLSVPGVDRR